MQKCQHRPNNSCVYIYNMQISSRMDGRLTGVDNNNRSRHTHTEVWNVCSTESVRSSPPSHSTIVLCRCACIIVSPLSTRLNPSHLICIVKSLSICLSCKLMVLNSCETMPRDVCVCMCTKCIHERDMCRVLAQLLHITSYRHMRFSLSLSIFLPLFLSPSHSQVYDCTHVDTFITYFMLTTWSQVWYPYRECKLFIQRYTLCNQTYIIYY